MHTPRSLPDLLAASCRCSAVAALACLALALPAAATADAAWHAPVDVSARGPLGDVDIAVSSRGDGVAVWTGTGDVVQSADRPARGRWQAPVALSPAGQAPGTARVAVDPQGDAVAVWTLPDGTVQSTTRPAGEAWQTPVAVSTPTVRASETQVAIDSHGNAVAAWVANGGAVQSAVRPAGAAWQPSVDVVNEPGTSPEGNTQGIDSLTLAVSPEGLAAAAWVRRATPDFLQATVQAAVRLASGSWLPRENVFVGSLYLLAPDIAIDAQGTAILVGAGSRPFGGGPVYGAVRPAGGGWQAPTDLSEHGSGAQVALDAQGNAVAVWDTGGVGRYSFGSSVQTSSRPTGGAWQPAVTISSSEGRSVAPQVAVDARGDAVAVWQRHLNFGPFADPDPDPDVVQGASRAAGAGWQAPIDLTAGAPSALSPHVAMDAAGDALAIWQRFDRSVSVVQSAAYDAAQPPPPRPAVTGLAVSPTTFHARRSGPAVGSVARITGTRVSYALSRAARVRFTVQRSRAGRRAAGRCVRATPANRGRPSCARPIRVHGAFSRNRAAGADRFTFTGRLGGRTLGSGSYRLVATPSAGGRAGPPARARFVVR